MVKKEYYSIWVLLLLILSVVMISLPSLTITGNASQVVAFDQVVSMYYPGSYDVSRVVAIPPGKESGNYIGPWDTVLYLTLPQKEVNIENNPSDSQFVDLIFNKNLEIKKPLNSLITLPYNSEVSIINNNNQGILAIFMIDQGYKTSGYAVREFTGDQIKMIKTILFVLILVCLLMIFRKKQ